MAEDRTNGFRITGLNQDCDRLAVQSTVAGTWFCSYHGSRVWGRKPWSREVGLCQNELVVLRPYRGKAEIEIEPLGGPYGVLIAEMASGGKVVMRNGSRYRFELASALVLKTEAFRPPGRDSDGIGSV